MAKYSAYGTQLKRGATAYVNVTSIDGPELALDTEDVTSHDSTGGWEEVVGTILRSGEISFDVSYDPNHATHKDAAAGLINDLKSRASTTFSLVFPSNPAATWTFTAFVTKFQPTAPVDGALTASCALKITGQPTLA